MAVKGNKREIKEFSKELFVGLTSVRVVAINPTRAELSKLLGNGENEKDEKEEYKYLDVDENKNERLRLTFWLHDEENNKYFTQSIYLVNTDSQNTERTKAQIVSSTCDTAWVPYAVDKKGNVTDKIDEKLILKWFLEFSDIETKEVTGTKIYKKAVKGEADLCTLLRSWLGKMNWYDADTEVMIDTKKLFNENYTELRELIDSGYDTPFVILLGVATDKEDTTKKSQKIFRKAYLPASYMAHIKNGLKFPSPNTSKKWNKFKEEVNGAYGFKPYTQLTVIDKYDEKKDPVASNSGKPQTEAANNDY